MSTVTAAPHVEICLRCGAAMEWRHATFQCPRCTFKIGCCEGETGECRTPAVGVSGRASAGIISPEHGAASASTRA